MPASEPWHCRSCGAGIDLAPSAVEVGLVRLAGDGVEGFRLGSAGIEAQIEPLLEPCECGGRFAAGGDDDGARAVARFDGERLRPVVARGWAVLEADQALASLREVWRPRALVLIGRGQELAKEDVLRLRLEDKLASLQAELERATAAGDDDAAETAHARYIELGTTYVRRFVRPDEPAARPG
jgi:hypothetical protein